VADLLPSRKNASLLLDVPGGPLAVPFRIIGRSPASCRGCVKSRDLSVHGLTPAPVFPPGTFLAIPRVIISPRFSAHPQEERLISPSALPAPPPAELDLPTAACIHSTHHTGRRTALARHNNSADDGNRMSERAKRTSGEATGRQDAWGGTPLFLGMYGHNRVARHRPGGQANRRPNDQGGWRGDKSRQGQALHSAATSGRSVARTRLQFTVQSMPSRRPEATKTGRVETNYCRAAEKDC
jgi:hypothetical protein